MSAKSKYLCKQEYTHKSHILGVQLKRKVKVEMSKFT